MTTARQRIAHAARDIDAEAAWIERLLLRPDVADETHHLINTWYEDAYVLAWVNRGIHG